MNVILVVLHLLLQRIIRRNSNRSNIFNNFIITRQISTTSLLGKFRKVKFIWLTIEFNRYFTFPAIYNSSTSLQKRFTKVSPAKTPTGERRRATRVSREVPGTAGVLVPRTTARNLLA